jgi:hypothetical protein
MPFRNDDVFCENCGIQLYGITDGFCDDCASELRKYHEELEKSYYKEMEEWEKREAFNSEMKKDVYGE